MPNPAPAWLLMERKTHAPRGRARQRVTSRGVRVADVLARVLITLGGIGTILTVSLVCVFLVWVVVPLFLRPGMAAALELASVGAPEQVGIDEYRTIEWSYHRDGTIRLLRLDDRTELAALKPFDELAPTAHALDVTAGRCAFGFADGTIRTGSFGFRTSFLDPSELGDELSSLSAGERTAHRGGILERTSEGQYRLQRFTVELEEPITLTAGSPVIAIDQSALTTGSVIAALFGDGTLAVRQVGRRRNLLTGKETLTLTGGELQVDLSEGARPRWLRLAGLGDNVFLVWESGRLMRFDVRDLRSPQLAETVDLVPEPGATLTALEFLIGKNSLAAGDSRGNLRIWFRVRPQEGDVHRDGFRLVSSHELDPGPSAVTSLAASERSRLLAAGHADGTVKLHYVTSHRVLAEVRVPGGGSVAALALGPKNDALLAITELGAALWRLDVPHPETSLEAIFRPVWYEGYEGPEHVWQSSSGTDDFEAKYGLVPLVFGTAKATLYSMLFGLPLAILAAIFTSEFMQPRLKARVKPTIELMASLPSVVLGFLAALVIAPFAEHVVPVILASLVTLPFTFLFGAHLWQMIPRERAPSSAPWRGPALWLTIPAGVAAAWLVAGPLESFYFGGDLKVWLSSGEGSAAGGWLFLLLPTSGLVVALASARFVNPRLRAVSANWSDRRTGLVDLGKFLCLSMGTLFVAHSGAELLALLGLDARGAYLGTFVQRNALVVGFVMGFAIIPIIYTIAEDALSAVPDHLRAASMGAGATIWQTAVRIVIPTAMSGLFSATMIGLGRAVGETMIVLMATGNTPVLDWNVFSGFRTLSANIAVELPEAVQNSTHYRMLFLAGLVLFAMTFLVNTVAELVRLRFRKRAFEL